MYLWLYEVAMCVHGCLCCAAWQLSRLCSLNCADIVDIKPANMEELTEVITAAECHPHQCNVFVYSSSKGSVRLCDMRSAALCDRHAKCESAQPHVLQGPKGYSGTTQSTMC